MELKDLADKLNTASTDIKNAQAEMQKEIKANGDVSAETKAAFEKHEANFAELKTLFGTVDAKLIELEQKSKKMESGSEIRKSMGELFTVSDAFTDMKSNERGNNVAVSFERKEITSGGSSAGALIRPDRDSRVFQDPNRPIRIRDLIPTVRTSANAVEIMRENVFTNNAAPQSAEFATKAESNISYELVTYPIRTIAHWVPASRQVLSDAPMLQNMIDNRLTYGLDLVSDAQLLSGSGTGVNLTGLLVDSGLNDAGELPSGTDAADVPSAMIDHIRKAIRIEQQSEYYNMNGLVLNPVDWEILETAKATDGHYLMVSMPTVRSADSVWRIPVIVSNAMPADTFLIGDWTLGAEIYDRESVSVRVSESHADYFVKNGVAILAEERYTLAIPLPKAYCKGSFVVAT
jgi:HK97 family phage major capsid protein